MSNSFERRWRTEFERRALRSLIPPKRARELNGPEDVQKHIEYIERFEAQHAVYWKWVLMWIFYPVLVFPLFAMQIYFNQRRENSRPLSVFIAGIQMSFLVGLYLGFLFKMTSEVSVFLVGVQWFDGHSLYWPEVWMHLNVTFGIALVMSVYLNLKMKANWTPFSLKVISCVAIFVLGYKFIPFQHFGTEWLIIYAEFFCVLAFALIGRHRFWKFPDEGNGYSG